MVFPDDIRLRNERLLVIRQTFQDLTNRDLADIVAFYNQGMLTIEKNNFGPPTLSLPIERINVYELLRYNNSSAVTILPNVGNPPVPFGLRGIFAIQSSDSTGIQAPNTDNEANNINFIARK